MGWDGDVYHNNNNKQRLWAGTQKCCGTIHCIVMTILFMDTRPEACFDMIRYDTNNTHTHNIESDKKAQRSTATQNNNKWHIER